MAETFVGWVPTVLGRLSFSRIGDEFQKNTVVATVPSQTGTSAIFGSRRRIERYAFSWLEWLWGGRVEITDYAFFLEPVDAELPYPNKISPKHGAACPVVLKMTPHGALKGTVYFTRSGINPFFGGAAVKAQALLRDSAVTAFKDTSQIRQSYRLSRRRTEAAWRLMRQQFMARKKYENFGQADVLLLRTGECRITLNEDLQSLLLGVKLAGESVQIVTFQNFNRMFLEDAATGVFLSIRDVVHKHYHHKSSSSVDEAVSRTNLTDDISWRTQTLNGLMRMCLVERRGGSVISLRNAQGILAYVDAFDRHLAGWYLNRGRPVENKWRPSYDFSALKASVDASLKARELGDQAIRSRLIFAFGFMVTAITLLAPIFRDQLLSTTHSSSATGIPRHILTDTLAFMARHPLLSFISAAGFGLLFDLAVTRLSVTRVDTLWQALTTRLTDGFVAWLRRMRVGSRQAQGLVLALIGIAIIACTAIWVRVAVSVLGSLPAYFESIRDTFIG